MTCQAPGCKRARRPDSPYCGDHFRAAVIGPVYRVRSRGRIEVRTARGNWQRMGMKPAGGVTESELSELELRYAFGDR